MSLPILGRPFQCRGSFSPCTTPAHPTSRPLIASDAIPRRTLFTPDHAEHLHPRLDCADRTTMPGGNLLQALATLESLNQPILLFGRPCLPDTRLLPPAAGARGPLLKSRATRQHCA